MDLAAAGVVLAASFALAGAALAARLAGALPLLDAAFLAGAFFAVAFLAGAFLAGAAADERFAGLSVAWLALVAATYALSVLRVPARADISQQASVMEGVDGPVRIRAAAPWAATGPHCNDTVDMRRTARHESVTGAFLGGRHRRPDDARRIEQFGRHDGCAVPQ